MPTELDQRPRRPRYSICTLVTKPDEYAEMVASFQNGGFTEPDCEYLFIDNSNGNKHDGFSGYNAFLSEARGEYIIICHQDILLIHDGKATLDTRLEEISSRDAHWAVCGNAGATRDGQTRLRISDPHNEDRLCGPLPAEVTSLDENFVVVQRAATLGVNPHLKGFHLYASELCACAASLGRHCYVIDFHLRHKSGGVYDASFFEVRAEMIRLRSAAMRPRAIATTGWHSTMLLFGGPPFMVRVGNRLIRSRLRRRVFRWINAKL